MSRYIDADEFKRCTIKFGEEQNTQELANWLCQYIDCFLTADVVEVVRCKDCKYWDSGECTYHSEPEEMRMYERWTVDVNENDFCSCGERK